MIKRGEGGITLIELVVVMSIIVITGVCLAPSIGEWREDFRIRQAVRDIVSNLQFAKMKAISSRVEYRVRFDLINDCYLLERNAGVWLQEGDAFRVPKGVDIDSATPNLGKPPRIEFNPDGTASSGHLTIDNEQGKTYKVFVLRTGRIRIEE